MRLTQHFEFELHVFVILGARNFNLLGGNAEVVKDRVMHDRGHQVNSSGVVKIGFRESSVIFVFDGGLTTAGLLVFDCLLHYDLVLARYVVELEHEFF